MTSFSEALARARRRAPETKFIGVIGTDGIPVERLSDIEGDGLDALAAEVCALMRTGLASADDTGMGRLEEIALAAEAGTVLVRSITREYVLVAIVGRDALLGRARAAVRLACLELEEQFL